jgi:hypothetical protein
MITGIAIVVLIIGLVFALRAGKRKNPPASPGARSRTQAELDRDNQRLAVRFPGSK